MKNDSLSNKKDYKWFYVAAIALTFIISFSYIFNSKLDLNGDNCDYYMLATSITQGHGYSNIATAEYVPTNVFPPGYPVLMTPLRLVTDSIIPQKILNGLFLLASSVLMFFFIRRNKLPDALAFIASIAMLLNQRVLHFATMMMSEMSFLLFSVFVVWCLYKLSDEKPFWKDKWFYLLVLSTGYGYHIRTQGITLAAAIICYLIVSKKWKTVLGFIGGYVVCLAPWMIRNKVLGVDGNRYIAQIFGVNNHRPEEGVLGIDGIIERFFETFKMLITKAIPNTVTPYFSVDYEAATTLGEWIIGIAMIAIIVYGFMQLGKLKYYFIFFTLATLGVISLFNDPGENRYITTLVPFLEIGLFVGLYSLILLAMKAKKMTIGFSPWFLAPLLLFAFPRLQEERAMNKEPFIPNYQNYFAIAAEVKKKLPPTTVVCSRKPNLFYMFSNTMVCNYKWTPDDVELIDNLVHQNVDYVVLEQLGYGSTFRYLYPAIQKHQELFVPVMYLSDPDTYLLKFDREGAKAKIQMLREAEAESIDSTSVN